MTQVYFTKISEHTAEIKDENVIIWRIKTIAGDRIQGNKVYYVRASKVHRTLNQEYWTDSRYLISEDKVQLPRTIPINNKESVMSYPGDPQLFQQLECGACQRVNLVCIDPAVQGAHYCTECHITVCIIAGKQMQLKNGTKTLGTIKGQRR